MLTVFTLISTLAIFSIVDCVYAEIQNATSKDENDNDFASSGTAFAGNFTANFSVSASGVDEKISNFSVEAQSSNDSISDRNGNQELHVPSQPAVQFNAPSNITTEPKKIDFRPSPQLETYYEYNKFPVKPAVGEAKIVRNFGNINSEDFAVGTVLPLENTDRQTSRNLNNFEPAFSAFGIPRFPNERSQNGLPKNEEGTNYNNNEARFWTSQTGVNEVNRKNENDDTPWVNRVRFPQKPVSNDSPYAFVPNLGSDPNRNNFNNNVLSPPKTNEYLPPSGGNNRYPPLTNKPDFSKNNNYNNINTNKVGYSPPTSNYGFTGGSGGGQEYTSFDSSGANNEEYNFNKFVEVPKTYYPGPPNYPQHHPTYETYNIMEKPSSETQHKTYGGGSYNPWKKILKLFATFIPIGLLISALTPTVISVSNVNDTGDMAATRYRSSEEPKKELANHIISSLDYFDKLNENGCEYRVFCELLVSASHMPNSKQHVDNLLDNFAKEEMDYKSRAEELRKVFAAVRSHDCNSIPCEFIKNPT